MQNKQKYFNKNSISFFLATALFVISAVFYTVHIPYTPDRLFKATPADAMMISSHENIAAHLRQITTNPLLDDFYNALREQLKSRGQDQDNGRMLEWIKTLTRRRTVFSYTPALEHNRHPVLTGAVWIGSHSIWARWLLKLKPPDGISEIKHSGPPPMWKFDIANDQTLSFSLDEGILVFCISPDPAAIHHAMLTYDGRLPSFTQTATGKTVISKITSDKDQKYGRGWFDDRLFGTHSQPSSVFFEINEFNEKTARFSFLLEPGAVPAYPAVDDSAKLSDLRKITADYASGMLFFSSELLMNALSPLLDENTEHGTPHILSGLIPSDMRSMSALGVFTDEFSGKLGLSPFRPTVPTLMLFIPAPSAAGALDSIQQIIDRLNSRFQTGLIISPDPVQAGDYSIFPFETTSGDFFTHTNPEDLPAFTQTGEWIVISSNLKGLTRLVAYSQTEAAKAAWDQCRWFGQFERFPAAIHAWFDTDSGGKAAQLMLAAYSFSLMGKPDPESRATVKKIGIIRDWIPRIRPFESLNIWINLDTDTPQIICELGNPD